MSVIEIRVASLPLWNGPISITPLAGGMTNRNLLVEARAGRFVVRISGENAAHGIDRAAERDATRAAAEAGLGPELVWSERDLMVLRLVEGHTLGKVDLENPSTRFRVLALLLKVGRDIPSLYRGEMPDRRLLVILDAYAERLLGRPNRWREAAAHHRPLLDSLVPRLAVIPRGFAHNDIHGDNLIDDGERLWLIDWEYAGQGQPLADVASLVNNALTPEDVAQATLRHWLGRLPNDADRSAFAAMRLATALRDLFWGYAQDAFAESSQADLAEYIAINEDRVKVAAARC